MDRGFYTSVSAMMSGTKKLNDISNNIANITTIGFKRDTSSITQFSNVLIDRMDEGVNVGNLTTQVMVGDTYTIFKEGPVSQTGLSNDYAILGEGFFKVDRGGDIAYTRDGSFKVDSTGYLVTSNGSYVMNNNNQRILHQEGVDYTSQLMVVNFDNLQTLERTNNNFFINKFGLSEEFVINNPNIRQGFLETSNVDAGVELTDMMNTQRYFQFNQQMLSVRDELLDQLSKF